MQPHASEKVEMRLAKRRCLCNDRPNRSLCRRGCVDVRGGGLRALFEAVRGARFFNASLEGCCLALVLLLLSSCVNHPPTLDPVPHQVAEVGSSVDLTAQATDPDGDVLTFFAERLPDGASLDTSSGRFTWSPEITYPRDYYMTLGVRDNGNPPLEDAQNVMLSVVEPGSMDSFGTLKVNLKDAATGEARFARVLVKGSDGNHYGSLYGLPHCLPAGGSYFYAPGSFESRLPPGPAEITVVVGTEYRPIQDVIQVASGQTTERDVLLERWIHMTEEGWYSGDVHVHANSSVSFRQGVAPVDRLKNTPEDARTMVMGEDINVANFLVAPSFGDELNDLENFEGGLHALSEPLHLLYWNQEFTSALFGHLTLLNLKNLVLPPTTGYELSVYSDDYPPNAVIADRTHDQGGVVIYAHPAYVEDDFASMVNPAAREISMDVALGKIDAIEVMSYWSSESESVGLWYRILNCGYRIPAVAGTDSFCNWPSRPFCSPPLGGNRTYVQTSALDYPAWIEGLTAGRSFVTNGPVISLTVDGKGVGSVITLSGPTPMEVAVEADARSQFPLDSLEVIQNGEVVYSQGIGSDPTHIQLQTSLNLSGSCWLAVRTVGTQPNPLLYDYPLFAHSNPVYVILNGIPIDSLQDRVFFLQQLDRLEQMVEVRDRFPSQEDKDHFLQLLQLARDVHGTALRVCYPSL